MMRATRLALISTVTLSLVGGCQTNEQTGGLVGAGGGALLGGVLGQAIGHNTAGTLIGASLGAVGGYFVGSAIGRQLDERDRAVALGATQQALDSNSRRPVHWASDHSGAKGSVVVTSVQPTSGGGECKTVQEVAYVKGDQVSQPSRYCRTADGSWAAKA